ncbi:MAG: ATP-dependent helicase [Chloroflexi bacterium]|nr:ATP-dependent helicase [Chloroflexota bacterium]
MTTPLHPLFRQAQQEIVHYKSGRLAVIAVPGSGKTFTLTHLAAGLVNKLSAKEVLNNTEILIVTFSNSAVYTLRRRIAQILQQNRGLLPYVGYRVRTLHGLAHDIVRERPALADLSDDFAILDEQSSRQMIREITQGMLRADQTWYEAYLAQGVLENRSRHREVYEHQLPDLAVQLCERFIKYCKDNRLSPGELYGLDLPAQSALVRFVSRVYDEYQRRLAYQGAVDFDDLILNALRILEENADFRRRLQKRWPYVLEDEAQDSSQSQERLLRLLTDGKNWVRVGDPNQAINTTFTTANPQYLRDFAQESGVRCVRLQQSGRSGRPIADLANALVRWTARMHPVHELRQTFESSVIEPAPPGDAQANPTFAETTVYIHYQEGRAINPDDELRLVVSSLTRWLPDNGDKTVAVLVPENRHGYRLLDLLQRQHIASEELLQSTSSVRQVAKTLETALNFLANPTNPALLSRLYADVWWQQRLGNTAEIEATREETERERTYREIVGALNRCRQVETFLWPAGGADWKAALNLTPDPLFADNLEQFRVMLQHWLKAGYMPADQLTLTLAQDLFRAPAELALSYKIALSLRSAQEAASAWSLPHMVNEVKAIGDNQRRFLRFEEVTGGYAPRPGVVTVATMHAAKGLEWDRVYLLSVNSYSFPSAQPEDTYIGERWFVRAQLNIEAELLAQINALKTGEPYVEGEATRQARLDYAAERLRLLYVAITRARRELIMLWNTGHYWAQGGSMVARPALPLIALHEYLDGTLSLPAQP